MKDVAKKADVSPSTVSRVLSNSKRISPATQQRVRAAMEELGYYPNAIARSLVNQNAMTLGLVLYRGTPAALSNPFFPQVIKGIAQGIRGTGYDLLMTPESGETRALDLLRSRKIDGVILLASRRQDPLLPLLRKGGYPYVLVGRTEEEEDFWVNNDNIDASCRAVQHLIRLGHRRIGLITGPRDFLVSLDRQQGYIQALEQANLPRERGLELEADFTLEGAFQAASTLLGHTHPPTAIFAADDLMALGVMRACQSWGLRIPLDISVVGFNDDPMATIIEPPLTTVSVQASALGERAAQMLLDLLEGKEIREPRQLLPARLQVRGTTASCYSSQEKKSFTR